MTTEEIIVELEELCPANFRESEAVWHAVDELRRMALELEKARAQKSQILEFMHRVSVAVDRAGGRTGGNVTQEFDTEYVHYFNDAIEKMNDEEGERDWETFCEM